MNQTSFNSPSTPSPSPCSADSSFRLGGDFLFPAAFHRVASLPRRPFARKVRPSGYALFSVVLFTDYKQQRFRVPRGRLELSSGRWERLELRLPLTVNLFYSSPLPPLPASRPLLFLSNPRQVAPSFPPGDLDCLLCPMRQEPSLSRSRRILRRILFLVCERRRQICRQAKFSDSRKGAKSNGNWNFAMHFFVCSPVRRSWDSLLFIRLFWKEKIMGEVASNNVRKEHPRSMAC